MSTKALIGILLAGTIGIVIFLFVHLSSDPSKGIVIGPGKAEACKRGHDNCLPEVKYVDTSGRAYNAESLAGKVVVVNFWATWCHPCQKEIPDLSKAYDKYKAKGVVFLGVMTDQPSDSDLLNFQSDFEMSYPIVRANSDILVSYNYPQALPTTFVFDRGGKQVDSHVGPLSESSLDRILEPLVAQN
jgi:thiol-disulfide isomerase/thioredoxin